MPDENPATDKLKKCLRCGGEYGGNDLYCRHCGLEIRGDAGAIESYLAKVVPLRVDVVLKDRFREQKVVEVETAELLADRAMKWMKGIGYFVGIPLFLAAAILSFFGYKTYSDLDKISQKSAELRQQVEKAAGSFESTQKRISDLSDRLTKADNNVTEQLAKLSSSQSDLENEVSRIKKRLNFSGSTKITPDTKSKIESQVERYIGFLSHIGFAKLEEKINVCIYPAVQQLRATPESFMCGSVPTTDMINAFYMFDNKTIAIHERLVDIPSVFLREYTHYALLQVGEIPFALGTIGAEAKGGEVESAIADYFVASFLGDPIIGRGAGVIFNDDKDYIRNLENNNQYDQVSKELHARGEVWAAALWACRLKLPDGMMDRIVLSAWKKIVSDAAADVRKDFLESEKIYVENRQSDCLDREMSARSIPK